MAAFAPAKVNFVDYIDKKVDELQANLDKRLDKQDKMLEHISTEVDVTNERLAVHASLPGHPLGMLRLENVEHVIVGQGEKKWKTWQIVAACIGFLIYLCSISISFLSLLLTLIWHLQGH